MARAETQKTPRFLTLAAVCVAIAALKLASDILIPLALSILFSFLLAPLVRLLERRRVPRSAAVVLVVGLIFSLLGVVGWAVAVQVGELAHQVDEYKGNIAAKVHQIRGFGSGKLSRAMREMKEVVASDQAPTTQITEKGIARSTNPIVAATQPGGNIEQHSSLPLLDKINDFLGGYISPIAAAGASILATGGITIVFCIFILLQREDLRDRLLRLAGEGRLQLATQAIDDAAGRISRYLAAQAIVNGTYGLAISIGLLLIGAIFGGSWFPSFILWGFLCGLLRFIPYIGPWIAAIFPVTVAFAVYPGYGVFFAVIAMFLLVEAVSNNVMEPWIYGSSTGMSSVAIIFAAAFWTWVWGTAGLVLSTPLTVCIVVFGKYVPQFRFFDILLGDQPVLEPYERLYQRLLAMDAEEATELAEDYGVNHTLEEVYDQMILPALALAERDQNAGKVDDARHDYIRRAMREMVDELGDSERMKLMLRAATRTVQAADGSGAPLPAEPGIIRSMLPKGCIVNVICLPAHDDADEIAAIILAQLLDLRGYCATAASTTKLASEMLDEVEKRRAQIVCVSALPPAAVTHARYLCKRVHARFPNISHVVGVWTVKGDLKKAKQRMACASNAVLTTTLHEALDHISQLAQPLLVAPSITK